MATKRRLTMYERFHFGKHKGRLVADVPSGYLAWCLREIDNLDYWLRRAIEGELERREALEAECRQQTHGEAIVSTKLVAVWYGRLAKEFHPDRGGSVEAMQAINRGRELLLELVEAN